MVWDGEEAIAFLSGEAGCDSEALLQADCALLLILDGESAIIAIAEAAPRSQKTKIKNNIFEAHNC